VTDFDDPYVYPGTTILRNRLNIRDSDLLDRIERRLVVQRLREGVPAGSLDLAHLRMIHRHLFHDVYEWAVSCVPSSSAVQAISFNFANIF
jgi:cell filamentation protein